MTASKGKFIVIEGLDGSGKTLQARKLGSHLRRIGHKVNLSFEPTNGPVGSIIRQAVIGRLCIDPMSLAALFAADRLDHLHNPITGVIKHIEEGIIEISDRYDLTSYAYQTATVDENWLWELNSKAIRPDLTIFLDVDPEECHRRLTRSKVDHELYHARDHLIESRTRYLSAIQKLQKEESIVLINGEGSLRQTSHQIIDVVTQFLGLSSDVPFGDGRSNS